MLRMKTPAGREIEIQSNAFHRGGTIKYQDWRTPFDHWSLSVETLEEMLAKVDGHIDRIGLDEESTVEEVFVTDGDKAMTH